jgi:hypothetical protein
VTRHAERVLRGRRSAATATSSCLEDLSEVVAREERVAA